MIDAFEEDANGRLPNEWKVLDDMVDKPFICSCIFGYTGILSAVLSGMQEEVKAEYGVWKNREKNCQAK